MAFFVFGGFGMSYLVPMSRGAFPPAPPIVHLHGLIFFSWMLLLITQSALVGAGKVRLHRSFGTWGIAHGTAIIMLGLILQLIATRRAMDMGFAAGTDGLYLGLCAFVGFSTMFALAIRNTHRPELHRRMILFAMLPVLPAGGEPVLVSRARPGAYSGGAALRNAMFDGGRHPDSRMARHGADQRLFAIRRRLDRHRGRASQIVVHSPPFDRLAAIILGMVHYR